MTNNNLFLWEDDRKVPNSLTWWQISWFKIQSESVKNKVAGVLNASTKLDNNLSDLIWRVLNSLVVNPNQLEWNESSWQLTALVLHWKYVVDTLINEAITEYIWNVNSENSIWMYMAFDNAINSIMRLVKDWLNEKIHNFAWEWSMLPNKLILWEELSEVLAKLHAYLNNIWTTDADSLQKIDVNKWRKIWNFLRKLSSSLKVWNKNPNMKAMVESDETRFLKLMQSWEEINRIIVEIQQYPKKTMNDINIYMAVSIVLAWLKKYFETEIKRQIEENNEIDNASKNTLIWDIDRMIIEINNFIALLDNSVNIYLHLIKESTFLWREIELNYLRAHFAAVLAVNQNSSTEIMKKWVWLAQILLKLEQLSYHSMMDGVTWITRSITDLWANRLKNMELLNTQISELTKSINNIWIERWQNNASLQREIEKLWKNAKTLWNTVWNTVIN